MRDTLLTEFHVRRPTMSDLKAVTAIVQASELADRGRVTTSEDKLRRRWKAPGFDLSKDAWLVNTATDCLVGMISVEHRDAERMYSNLHVHPDYAGLGVPALLLELAVGRARELVGKACAGARVTLNVFSVEQNAEYRQALEQAGFTHVRSDWLMRLDMAGPPPAPVWPQGVELRPYTPDMLVAIYEADNEAFRDHWGYLPIKFEMWQTWTVKREGFDPGLWFLAFAGKEIAGIALCEYELGEAWIGELAVRRPWRHQGLGLALLHHAFGEFYRRDMRKVLLNVDSQNLTGATRLYIRAGMRQVEQTDMYELELRSGIELSTEMLTSPGPS